MLQIKLVGLKFFFWFCTRKINNLDFPRGKIYENIQLCRKIDILLTFLRIKPKIVKFFLNKTYFVI